jgi:hypothetical protein
MFKQRRRRAHKKDKIFTLTLLDDLKLIVKSEGRIEKSILTVKIFNDDILMDFGLEKCARITFKKGKLFHFQKIVIDTNRKIQELEQGKRYTYLGIEEREGIQHKQMKERLKKNIEED